MSGTLQLFSYAVLTGVSIGLGVSAFRDSHFWILVGATVLWLIAMACLADSLWVSGLGSQPTRSRIRKAIKACGFGMATILLLLGLGPAVVAAPPLLALLMVRVPLLRDRKGTTVQRRHADRSQTREM